ncbi:unnamed protein product, partial [Prorocentrum cordatum]
GAPRRVLGHRGCAREARLEGPGGGRAWLRRLLGGRVEGRPHALGPAGPDAPARAPVAAGAGRRSLPGARVRLGLRRAAPGRGRPRGGRPGHQQHRLPAGRPALPRRGGGLRRLLHGGRRHLRLHLRLHLLPFFCALPPSLRGSWGARTSELL